MRRASFLFSLLFCLCALLPDPAVRAGAPPHRAVAGPFTLSRDGGTPLVEVTFSSGKTGLFMIDTGAYDSVMTPACVKRLGYKQDDNALYLRGLIYDGFTLKAPTVHAADLRIGRLQVSDITFAVAPGEVGTENGRPLDGLLGGNLLSRFALLLDYPHRTLSWIYPGNLDDATVTELGMDPKSALGLHQEEYFGLDFKINHYSTQVPMQSGSQKGVEEMFFDTGSPMTSLSAETAQRMKLASTGLEPYEFVFQAPDYANKGMVSSLQIGPQVFSDVSLIYPSHSGSYMVPLIGANILGGCVVLFDFGPHRCFLQPSLLGFTSGPLPALNTSRIDWERLRNAPEPLGFSELVRGVLHPETLDSLPQELARLRSSSAEGPEAAEKEVRLGMLLRQNGNETEAKEALSGVVRLRQAEADAYPEDPVRAAQWTDALAAAGQEDAALAAAEKNASRWPASPVVLRSLGFAQEARAVSLLLGHPAPSAEDEEAAEPFLGTIGVLAKPDPAKSAMMLSLSRLAQGSYSRAIVLAPLDPEGYHCRARYWLLDRWLVELFVASGVKGQFPSEEAATAAELSDYQNEARLRPEDVDVLRQVAMLDAAQPLFHDGDWLRLRLHGAGQGLGMRSGDLLSAEAAQKRLAVLSQSSDPKTAAPALEALGEAQADTDDPAAEATLQKVLAQDPARPGALASLAALMVADNRLSALGDLLLKQSGAGVTPASCLLLSGALSAVGQTATAEEEAREALKRLPDSPQANMALARLLLARSGDDPSVLPEAGACLTKAEIGLGSFASPVQKASLQTLQAVHLALSGDPTTARTQLLKMLHDRPSCTQAREALYALSVPPVP